MQKHLETLKSIVHGGKSPYPVRFGTDTVCEYDPTACSDALPRHPTSETDSRVPPLAPMASCIEPFHGTRGGQRHYNVQALQKVGNGGCASLGYSSPRNTQHSCFQFAAQSRAAHLDCLLSMQGKRGL